MTTIAILKIASGEELISEINVIQTDAPGQEIVQLINPCAVERVPTGDGSQVTARFMPIAAYCKDKTIQMSNMHIVYTGVPEQGFQDAYVNMFPKSVIDLPPEQKLIVPQ